MFSTGKYPQNRDRESRFFCFYRSVEAWKIAPLPHPWAGFNIIQIMISFSVVLAVPACQAPTHLSVHHGVDIPVSSALPALAGNGWALDTVDVPHHVLSWESRACGELFYSFGRVMEFNVSFHSELIIGYYVKYRPWDREGGKRLTRSAPRPTPYLTHSPPQPRPPRTREPLQRGSPEERGSPKNEFKDL